MAPRDFPGAIIASGGGWVMAYTVEYGNKPCEHCGIGGTWDIVGPDGVAIGVSFGDKDDAEEWAGTLSHAYELGKGGAPSWDDAIAALAHGDIHEALIGHIGGIISSHQMSMGAIRSVLHLAAEYIAANKPKE
jgi:hypothetical protein